MVPPHTPLSDRPASGSRPELLAPAGDWDCARAAVENGADAIYFGLSRFNARLRARNFTEADLPELMAWLHRRGVRGYVTFNTLVFTEELAEAEAYLRTLIAAGVDAAIVQDIGVCRLIRRLSPDFPIHASTQMTVTSAAGVAFARELGASCVVLARENSIAEIRRIQESLRAQAIDMPLEVFVHGALCVAYSGQCLTSEALGGRSANRGECAQACRLPYDLLCDGRPVDLGDRRYLLSPQDLAGLELIPDLVEAGVASLKIEGRLKSAEYVASITRLYRGALDRAWTRHCGETTQGSNEADGGGPAARYEMEMAFSRGLSTGWLAGNDNQRLVHGRFGKKRGAYLGEVTRIDRDRVWLRGAEAVKAGDGVVFDAGRPEEREEGGRVFDVRARRGSARDARGDATDEVGLSFLPGAVDFRRIRVGDRVWKTSDPELERALRESYAGDGFGAVSLRPVQVEVRGRAGTPLTVRYEDESGNAAEVTSAMALEVADRRPLDAGVLGEQLGRLGGTPFRLGELRNGLEGAVILPIRELNRLRREAVSRLEALRAAPRRWTVREDPIVESESKSGSKSDADAARARGRGRADAGDASEAALVVLVRTLEQLDGVLGAAVRTVYCEFEDPRRYREAVRRVRARGGAEVFVAPPRIFKPGEEWILNQVRSAEADGYLVRNPDHLAAFAGARCVGDFSWNVANPLSAEYLAGRYGLERIVASHDLNADQIEALLRRTPGVTFEVTLHQHMPMFHMEHCVFCAFLSRGKDYRDCGRPCDRHEVRLRDRVGAAHPVKADAGCRNTVFHARAQTGAEHALRFRAAGARWFRIEFLDEPAPEAVRLLERYGQLLRGEVTGEALWREFRLVNQQGVTRGQLGLASGADLGVNRWTDAKAYAAAW